MGSGGRMVLKVMQKGKGLEHATFARWSREKGTEAGTVKKEVKERWVALWGNGDFGRLGLRSLESRWEPTLCSIPQHCQPSSIACGGAHTLILTEEGRVFAAGLNDYGQLGVPFDTGHSQGKVLFMYGEAISVVSLVWEKMHPKKVCIANEVKPLNGLQIKTIALGSEHSLALTVDGKVLSWGLGENGRLGHGYQSSMFKFLEVSSEYTPKLIKPMERVKICRIAAGLTHSACIDGNGDVYAWGSSENGCLGLGSQNIAPSPKRVQGSLLPLHVSEVSCGWKHTAVISGGNVFTWGWGGSQGTFSDDGFSSGGQLGLGNEFDYLEPARVRFSQNVNALQISCGFNHTGAIIEER